MRSINIDSTILKKTALIFIASIFLLVTGYFYKQNALAFAFVDEQYNFAIGKYLLNGEFLYEDIITNHQPLTHIFSSLVQLTTKPNTTFLLVNRHRIAIIVWTFVWSLFFVAYFGMGSLIFIVVYELTKSHMFGELFLAESIVVYPLLFLIGLIIQNKEKLTFWELILSGLCFGLVVFLLGPIWPALGFMLAYLLYRRKNKFLKTLSYILVGFFVVFLLVYKFTSFPGYFHYYLITNLLYTVPQYHQSYDNPSWIISLLDAFISPLLSFTSASLDPIIWIIRLETILLILNFLILTAKKQYRLIIITPLILTLLNIRFYNPGSNSFHVLPWYASILFITSLISIMNFKLKGYLIFKLGSIILISAMIIFSFKYAQPLLFSKRDIFMDYTINYSTHTDIGNIIKIIRKDNDTLFVSPDAWMVYWASDTKHLANLFGYYTWMSGIPELHKAVLDEFKKSPPTFFYCTNCLHLDLGSFFNRYIQVKKNGNTSNLYILPDRVKNLTKFQLEQLSFYNVTF